MTVYNQNIRVSRGDTAVLFVALTTADNLPYDASIPGVVIKWRVARTAHALETEALVRKQLGDGIEAVEGGIEITLDAGDCDFRPGIYHHELRVWDGDDTATAMVGALVVQRALPMGEALSPETVVLGLSAEVPSVA